MKKAVRKQYMRLITCHLPKHYVDNLDYLVEKGVFPSRSEAIRIAVRELLNKELYTRRKRIELVMG